MAKVWLDLSEIVASPEFTQSIIVERSTGGRFVGGRWQEEVKRIKMNNVVVSASDEADLNTIPEGDRTGLTKTIHTLEPLYMTHFESSEKQNNSDVVIYNGRRYKVVSIMDADDYGFTKAVITQIGGS